MKKSNLAVTATIASLVALHYAHRSTSSSSRKEKCYGVSKAGKNDCATKTSSCAGTAKEDNQSDAFVVVPKGLCGKLTGGSTESA